MLKKLAIFIVIGVITAAVTGFYILGCAGATDGGEDDGIFIIEGSWQPSGSPDMVSSGSGSSDPHVFFYAAKKANVVWNVAGDGYVVYSNAFTGSVWAGQQSRTGLYNTPPTAPRIFSNGSNVSFAIWRGGSFYASVWAARIDEEAWPLPANYKELSTPEMPYNDGPQDIACKLGTDELAFGVWRKDNTGEIQAARYGSSWEAAHTFSEGKHPRVAVDESGNALFIWRYEVDDSDYGKLAYGRHTGSWSGTEIVSTDSIFDNAESAEVSYGLGGIAMAVWRRESDNYIMASRYNGTWSSNKDISGGDGANPEIAFDPDGNVIAVWQNTFGSEIYIRRFLASSTWPNWEGDGPLLFDSAETAGNPQISVDPGGNVFIVWERDGQILAKRYEAGSDWASWVSSGPVTVLDDSGSNPEIAVDANGRAIAVWVSGGNIYSKRYFE